MPRRIIDYAPEFAGWNYVSSMGAFMTGLSSSVLHRHDDLDLGVKVGVLATNYWGEGATTLEWTVSSPPPFHTFEEQPIHQGRAGALSACFSPGRRKRTHG